MTFNIEIGGAPQTLMLCYSTTPPGSTAPAVTGGVITIYDSGAIGCWQDTSPVVVGLSCAGYRVGDGYVVAVTLTLQDTPLSAGPVGVNPGTPRSTACLDNVLVYTPAGSFGPTDVGACADQ